jgi:hypothetical protein
MKKYTYILICFCVLFFGSISYAQQPTIIDPNINQPLGSGLTPCTDAKSEDCYQLLEPLPQNQYGETNPGTVKD